MKYWAALAVLIVTAATAHAGTADVLRQSRTLAAQQRYDEALTVIEQARKTTPNDSELLLAKARILAWKGDYAAAQAILTPLARAHPRDDDILLAQAALYGYEGKRDEAAASYRRILDRNPRYQDARDGLARLEKQATTREGFEWQLDAGSEVSSFSRSSNSDWNQQFLRLNHYSADRTTVVHGQFTRYRQFDTTDQYYEAGVTHRFTPGLNGYVLAGVTPHANFRPDSRLGAGGEVRLDTPGTSSPAWWATLEMQYDRYPTGDIALYAPALRVEPAENWAVTARRILVDPETSKMLYGWLARLDGEVIHGLRFQAGYANAPEAVAGIAVDTKTYFGGIAVDLDDAHTLHLGYTRDDRQNSFIRNAIDASISYRF